jgi:hypothetical protein
VVQMLRGKVLVLDTAPVAGLSKRGEVPMNRHKPFGWTAIFMLVALIAATILGMLD